MHAAIHLGGQHDLVALRKVLERPADDFLARTVGIDVGGVEEIDAVIERLFDEGARGLIVERPGDACRETARRSSCNRDKDAIHQGRCGRVSHSPSWCSCCEVHKGGALGTIDYKKTPKKAY
jgi:hypothetical protein